MAVYAYNSDFQGDYGNITWFRGVVDPIIMAHRFNGPNYKGTYTNQLFPGVTGIDPLTVLNCADDHEYFDKISNLLSLYRTSDEDILERYGPGDKWGTRLQYECYKNNPERYFEVLDAAIEGAACNNAYLLLTMFGFADSTYSTDFQGLFDRDSNEYWNYIDYMGETVNFMAGRKGVFGIEIANEPDHDFQACRKWRNAFPNVDDAIAGYVDWSGLVHDDVAHLRRGQCLIGMGHAMQAAMFICDRWSGCSPPTCAQWNARLDVGTVSQFVVDCTRVQDYGSAHLYDMTNNTDLTVWKGRVDRVKASFAAANKPGFIGEWANMNGGQVFVPAMDDYMSARRVSNTCMKMLGRPNYPPSPSVVASVRPTPEWGCSNSPLHGTTRVCEENAFSEPHVCPDGTTIYLKKCQNDAWVNTGNICSLGGDECVPQYVDCGDGTSVMVKECVDGVLRATGRTCPQKTTSKAPLFAVLGALGAGALVYMLKK